MFFNGLELYESWRLCHHIHEEHCQCDCCKDLNFAVSGRAVRNCSDTLHIKFRPLLAASRQAFIDANPEVAAEGALASVCPGKRILCKHFVASMAFALNVMFSAVHPVGQVQLALQAMLQAMSSMASVNMWSSLQPRVKFSHILDISGARTARLLLSCQTFDPRSIFALISKLSSVSGWTQQHAALEYYVLHSNSACCTRILRVKKSRSALTRLMIYLMCCTCMQRRKAEAARSPSPPQVSQKEGMKARRHKKAGTLAHEVITRALVEVELITNTYAARFDECEKENTPESRVRRYCYSACTAQWI